jgi:hypothetical protein
MSSSALTSRIKRGGGQRRAEQSAVQLASEAAALVDEMKTRMHKLEYALCGADVRLRAWLHTARRPPAPARTRAHGATLTLVPLARTHPSPPPARAQLPLPRKFEEVLIQHAVDNAAKQARTTGERWIVQLRQKQGALRKRIKSFAAVQNEYHAELRALAREGGDDTSQSIARCDAAIRKHCDECLGRLAVPAPKPLEMVHIELVQPSCSEQVF